MAQEAGGGTVSQAPPAPTQAARNPRSPVDVLRLVTAAATLALLLLVEWLFGATLVGFAADLLRGLDAVPHWMLDAVVLGTRVVTVVVLGAGLAVTVVRNGSRMLATVGVAVLLAVVGTAVLRDVPHVSEERAPAEVTVALGPLTDSDFPSTAGVAAMAAALTAGAPWLTRRWRRWGWAAVVGLAVTRFLTAPLSMDSLEAVIIGWTAGAAVLVALGAPSRRPTHAAIARGLAAGGLPLRRLERACVDARGSTPYFGVGPDGTRYFVKALGADERSADLLFRLYRTARRHDFGDERPFSSLRRSVEHEAFLALAARDLGVPTPHLRAIAVAEPNGYVLAYEALDGRSLDGVPPQDITDDVLAAIWQELGRLRAVRLAHRDLRLANLFLGSDGRIWLIDFGFSEVAASDLLLANDVAELVASSAAVVGAERATAPAIASVDPATLAAARDRLHLWSLSGASRTALKQQPGLLEDLRARLAAV